eukprot:COSAG06_NODE_1245_length_10117_cov_28.671990_13_plen_58_part_00
MQVGRTTVSDSSEVGEVCHAAAVTVEDEHRTKNEGGLAGHISACESKNFTKKPASSR